MKTTLDLPDALLHQVTLRATQEGRDLNDTVAELLQRGLSTDGTCTAPQAEAVIATSQSTGFPIVEGSHAAAPGEEMTPDRVAAILLAQEATWQHATGR